MTKSLDPFRFRLIALSGWMNQQQLQLIDYLREENRVLRQHWDLIVAADFFTSKPGHDGGLQRFVILFFMELSPQGGDCWDRLLNYYYRKAA